MCEDSQKLHGVPGQPGTDPKQRQQQPKQQQPKQQKWLQLNKITIRKLSEFLPLFQVIFWPLSGDFWPLDVEIHIVMLEIG